MHPKVATAGPHFDRRHPPSTHQATTPSSSPKPSHTNSPVPSLPPQPEAQAQTMDVTWKLFPGVVGTENNFAVGCLFMQIGQGDVEDVEVQYKSTEEKMPLLHTRRPILVKFRRCTSY